MKSRRLYIRILEGNLANVAFDDLVRLLEALGYELRRISGDHYLFKPPIMTRS